MINDAVIGIKKMNARGFSLVELLVVIAIIGILAGVATTSYVGSIKKAARSEAYSTLENLRLLEEQFFAENADYTAGAANTAAIRALLPGFQPGNSQNFTYQIVKNFALDTPVAIPPTWGTAQNPCFTAVATGIAGTRVVGDIFAIDCNNNRSF
jgi:prepilin-type N-terminal cleavage/methylation domain-containing protein